MSTRASAGPGSRKRRTTPASRSGALTVRAAIARIACTASVTSAPGHGAHGGPVACSRAPSISACSCRRVCQQRIQPAALGTTAGPSHTPSSARTAVRNGIPRFISALASQSSRLRVPGSSPVSVNASTCSWGTSGCPIRAARLRATRSPHESSPTTSTRGFIAGSLIDPSPARPRSPTRATGRDPVARVPPSVPPSVLRGTPCAPRGPRRAPSSAWSPVAQGRRCSSRS